MVGGSMYFVCAKILEPPLTHTYRTIPTSVEYTTRTTAKRMQTSCYTVPTVKFRMTRHRCRIEPRRLLFTHTHFSRHACTPQTVTATSSTRTEHCTGNNYKFTNRHNPLTSAQLACTLHNATSVPTYAWHTGVYTRHINTMAIYRALRCPREATNQIQQ